MIIECLSIFKNITKGRNFRQIIRDLLKCAIVLISFVLYYVLWLSKTAGNAGGADYWNLLRFPLIPKSLSDIMLIIRMGRQFLAFYPTYIALFLGFLFFLYVVKVIISKKDESLILMPSIVSLLLLFVASYVGFYPVQARLVQVYCIVLLIFCGFMCQEIETSYVTEGKDFIKKCDKGRILYYSLLAGILGITGMYGCKNLFAKHVYKSGSEVSESIAYLEDKLKDTDAVYVYRSSIPVFTYETNYKVGFSDLKELPYQEDGIIWGQGLFSYDYKIPYSYEGHSNTTAVLEDANLIKDNQSVYLFTSHGERGVADLINELQKNGTVTMVVDSYNTHLYHYEKE